MIKQAIRMGILGSVSAFVALAAMPATAAAYVQAYVRNFVSGAPDLEVVQRLDAPASGPASVSATRPTGTTFSITDYGLQRNYASADLDVLGNQQSSAKSQFEDWIVIDTGTPGESGVATFQLRLTGTLFASISSSSGEATASTQYEWYNPDISSGREIWSSAIILRNGNDSSSTPIDQILTFQRSYVSGQQMLLSAIWSADASVFLFALGSGSAYADLSKTARWLGLQSAVTSGGQNVTSAAVITSNSGFDYSRPVTAPVPLPAAAWLMLSGLAGLGIMGRRKKA